MYRLIISKIGGLDTEGNELNNIKRKSKSKCRRCFQLFCAENIWWCYMQMCRGSQMGLRRRQWHGDAAGKVISFFASVYCVYLPSVCVRSPVTKGRILMEGTYAIPRAVPPLLLKSSRVVFGIIIHPISETLFFYSRPYLSRAPSV